MSLYWIGMCIAMGRLMVQTDGEPDTLKNALVMIWCALLWPLLLGIEIEHKIEARCDNE